MLVKFQIVKRENVVLEVLSRKKSRKSARRNYFLPFKLLADVRFVITRRIISSVEINIIAFLLRAKLFFLTYMFKFGFVRWPPNRMNIWRHNKRFMTWLALAPHALHNIRPPTQDSLPGNEVPVHSPSCHVQSYPRKGLSLNSWLTQRYFFTYFNAPVSKTILLHTPPHPQKNLRQMSISPLFSDSSTNHFQVSDSGYVSNSEQRHNNLSFDFQCKH